jgi:hypothetical protein
MAKLKLVLHIPSQRTEIHNNVLKMTEHTPKAVNCNDRMASHSIQEGHRIITHCTIISVAFGQQANYAD